MDVIAEVIDGVRRRWWDHATRTYHEYNAAGVETLTRPYSADENARADARASAEARAAALDALRDRIVTDAIAWLEADAAAAQTRADSVTSAVATATNRQAQAQAFVFNGATVSAINTQLNTGLKPLLVDMLTYIIGLGNLAAGMETWRGTRADPALIWLARHGTGTTD